MGEAADNALLRAPIEVNNLLIVISPVETVDNYRYPYSPLGTTSL
jgi:hypothetical protein